MEVDNFYREEFLMKYYKIPFDIKHEEKILGGYLSLRQVIYLLLCIICGGIFFIKTIQIWIRTMIFIIVVSFFMAFAFISIKETRLDKYLLNIIKYFIRKKRYLFER